MSAVNWTAEAKTAGAALDEAITNVDGVLDCEVKRAGVGAWLVAVQTVFGTWRAFLVLDMGGGAMRTKDEVPMERFEAAQDLIDPDLY